MSEDTYAYIWTGFFILCFLDIFFILYVSYSKLEEAEEYLKNSSEVITQRYIWKSGPIGKTMRLMRLGGVLARPNFYHRHKLASMEDIEKIPRSLKAWILTPCHITVCLCVFMFGFWAWEELIKRL
ncbi:hypothetical protein [Modicisalibacter muralis]|uniref:hypothetical protein n=1 Tax=Modicisalibacter muralis TaxID=119000 RepID=UPI00111427B9|nr:hypothetical protein [Halomonas muralis]